MLYLREQKSRRTTLLERFGEHLGTVVQRDRAEMALLASKQDAERAAERARQAMMEAQTANRAKTEFLANMSHELRTPLNAIIGFSEMMIQGLLAPDRADKHMEYARGINESGQHLLELICDILDLAKVEAGKLELDEETIAFEKLTQACLILIKERALENGIRLHFEVPSGLPQLFVDERKFKQILINLLSNAIKFTPSGGMVALTVGMRQDGGFLFKVSDTGIGIAKDDIAMALSPFTQVNRDIEQAHEGTGLGLPLSNALVELHGGLMTIESEVGVGTTVTVHVPSGRVRRSEGTAGASQNPTPIERNQAGTAAGPRVGE